MRLFKDYVSQTRKPEGFLGKMMLKGMNSGHAKMADWGLGHLQNIAAESIVDLGCGGGRNAGELLRRFPGAHVTAVDYSELSVEKAKEYILAYGEDRIFFGTDYPMWNASEELMLFDRIDLTDSQREKILWNNITEFLGFSEK